MKAFPATWQEAVADSVMRQLPPMRRLDRWWRRRPRRVKALYYLTWAVSMVLAARFASHPRRTGGPS